MQTNLDIQASPIVPFTSEYAPPGHGGPCGYAPAGHGAHVGMPLWGMGAQPLRGKGANFSRGLLCLPLRIAAV